MVSTALVNNCSNCGNKRGSEICKSCIVDANDPFSDPSEWCSKSYAEEQLEHAIEKQKEMVNHPDHYRTDSGLETIDVIEAFCDGLNGIEAFCTGNAIKYLCRWRKKNGVQDLKKAEWYLQRLIRHMELVEAKK